MRPLYTVRRADGKPGPADFNCRVDGSAKDRPATAKVAEIAGLEVRAGKGKGKGKESKSGGGTKRESPERAEGRSARSRQY